MKGTPGLAALRVRLGMRQKQLAVDTGIRRPLLSKIESGRVNPSVDEVQAIARGLGVPEAEVLACLKIQVSRVWKKRSERT